jgi:hypothetical protein
MQKEKLILIKKMFLCCITATFFIGVGIAVNHYYSEAETGTEKASVIYKKKSKIRPETISISQPEAEALNEFSIIVQLSYDYHPKENYYATIIDSCQSKFRLMMHEHSSLRAYCNSGILWSKTVDQFQVNKVLPPSVYHVVFTYKKGMATSFIDGNLNWTKSVADKPVNLSRFSLLQKCPSNKASGFGDKYVGEVESVVILDKSFTPEEVAKVFKNDVAENKMLGTELAVKYLLPWTLIFFLCWNLPNIMVFFEKGIGKKRTIELYILFIYAVMITLSIVYSFGTGIVKEINASLTGAFVASYTFWLIYCCFLSFYLVILYKLFRRPLLQAISCLYFITALLVYSLWLGTAKQLVPFWENLFIAICIATFMLIPLFNEDSK